MNSTGQMIDVPSGEVAMSSKVVENEEEQLNSKGEPPAILINMAYYLERWNTPVSRCLAIVGATLVLLMSLIIVADVLLRSIFDSPIGAAIEYEQFMLVAVVFLGVSYTMIKKGHVNVDIFSSKFPSKVKIFTESFIYAVSIFLFVTMAVENASKAMTAFKFAEKGGVSGFPVWPFYGIIVLGCSLVTIVLIANLLKSLASILSSFSRPLIWLLILLIISALTIPLPLYLNLFSTKLGTFTSGVFGIAFLVLLMMLGFPIAFAMGFIGLIGNWYLSGAATSFGLVGMTVYDTVADYFFCVIPLFILMGYLCYAAELSSKLYGAAYKWFGQLPGGLSIATIFGCAGFAAICGDSMATAATMGSVSIPEMKKFRYRDSLATGCVAAGGTLGILIPPSIGFIVYGIITELSVAKLFMAGVLPGILLTILFAVMIAIRCKLDPSLGPAAPKFNLTEKLNSLTGVLPVVALFVLVIGGLYRGIFSPTEAGGIGAAGALIIAVLSKGFSRKKLLDALLNTCQMTAMIFIILVGVVLLGYFVSLSKIPLILSSFLVSLPVSRYVILALILSLYLILGMLMNIVPMIMLTLPIIFPSIIAMGFDPIWFGVIMVIMMEMGQITPPVGINVFVISGVASDVPMIRIFKGILPFILIEITVIIILVIFPEIALVLPDAMDVLPAISD